MTDNLLIRRAEGAVASARRLLEQAERDLAQARQPDDPFSDGDVLRFGYQHQMAGTYYDYAAIRAKGRWFTTGSTCPSRGYSYANLLKWLGEGRVRGNGIDVLQAGLGQSHTFTDGVIRPVDLPF